MPKPLSFAKANTITPVSHTPPAIDFTPSIAPVPFVNHASPMCSSGNYMFFCESTSSPVCGVCPAGTATDRASYICETCTSGYFAEAGSQECSPCPAGKYGNGDGGVVEATACR